jgi:hypothetical protein
MAPIDSPLTLSLALLACWALVGAAGLLRPNSVALVGRGLFPLGAVIGVCLAVVAALSLNQPVERATLLIGLPDLPMHVPQGRRHGAGRAGPRVPPLSRQHGIRAGRR